MPTTFPILQFSTFRHVVKTLLRKWFYKPMWSLLGTMVMCLETLTFSPKGRELAAFNVISDLSTAFIPLDSKSHMPLRWSRGSVLAFGTQVRGFIPDRSRRIFQGEKILSTPSFGEQVKPSVPCRRLWHVKDSWMLRGSRVFQAKFIGHFSPT